MEGWVRYIRNQYFPVCPFCYGKVTIVYKARGKDFASCLDCGAKWHIYLKKGRDHTLEMTWAMLIEDGIDGKGKAYLGKKYDSSIWKRWSLKAKRKIASTREIEKPSVEIKEKEVVKEKEVIVKIRCPYCHNLYNESLDKCPHCGGKR